VCFGDSNGNIIAGLTVNAKTSDEAMILFGVALTA
jgi:hypothetical protein